MTVVCGLNYKFDKDFRIAIVTLLVLFKLHLDRSDPERINPVLSIIIKANPDKLTKQSH